MQPAYRNWKRSAALAVLMIAIGLAAYLVRFRSRQTLAKRPPAIAVPQSTGDSWLARLNYYRTLARLAPVIEDPALSKATANHARYLVANDAEMIRSGKLDASIHTEDPARPFYTPEGNNAGALSDIDVVYTDPPETPTPGWAIENWVTGPLHRMWMLNPALREVGYGQYCEKGICAAALNIRSGIRDLPIGVTAVGANTSGVVMFPPDGATIADGTFSADEAEWPDPLASCGYSTPTGLPITIQLGGDRPVKLEQSSIARNGSTIDSCAFDASSYKSDDAIGLRRTRKELTHFGAIVLVPKTPLVPGDTYTVSIVASGQPYKWTFSVASH